MTPRSSPPPHVLTVSPSLHPSFHPSVHAPPHASVRPSLHPSLHPSPRISFGIIVDKLMASVPPMRAATVPATPDAKISLSRAPATVLVVDADDAVRESTALALSRAGCVVIQAADLSTARDELGGFGSQSRFDAVVADSDLATNLNTHGIPLIVMGSQSGPDVSLLKPARSVEILGAIASAGGFGQRSCVLVEDTNGDMQRRWVKRLARHGAVVASSRSGAAFVQAATLFRPRVAVVGWAAEKRTFDLCRALGASLVVASEETSP